MSEKKDRWEVYADNDNKWRWHRVARNGKVVGAATEGYANKADCINNMRRNGYSPQMGYSELER
ncbi:DUF1508 domain-containing protein [Aestuariibacter sp. AA17]|uniref:DUF1508 domain-containing protein n=1 Tax=Fluctibacter corallii TaxID=2984329 RepID=A0ABT3AD98_9ALTE|nr:DUF1508 domain-containing protein [Aestuariibacter sp. AA17]MCV2886618.1 DUF1508 domain-containing protein [Aestuariibacter sp. AA17]